VMVDGNMVLGSFAGGKSDGWTEGASTGSVVFSTGLAPQPVTVPGGGYAMIAEKSPSVWPIIPSYVQKVFAAPVDMSDFDELSFWYNYWGGVGGTGAALLKLTAADGTSYEWEIVPQDGNWHLLTFDISAFDKRDQIAKIEIGLVVKESTYQNGWNGKFSMADIMLPGETLPPVIPDYWVDNDGYDMVLGMFEGTSTDGWTTDADTGVGIAEVESAAALPPYGGHPQFERILHVTMLSGDDAPPANGYDNAVVKDFTELMDLTECTELHYSFLGYGHVEPHKYWSFVILTDVDGNTAMVEKPVWQALPWNDVSINISEFIADDLSTGDGGDSAEGDSFVDSSESTTSMSEGTSIDLTRIKSITIGYRHDSDSDPWFGTGQFALAGITLVRDEPIVIPPTEKPVYVDSVYFGEFNKGDTVTLTAGSVPAGMWFAGWEFDTPVTFLDGTNKYSPTVKFTMPDSPVNVTAKFELVSAVTLPKVKLSTNCGGTVVSSTDIAMPGVMVALRATPTVGYVFQGWQILSGGVIFNLTTNPVTFAIGSKDVEIRAIFVSTSFLGMITGVSVGNQQANVDFPIISANGKGYSVYLSKDGGATYNLYTDVNYNSKGAHIKSLTNGVTYFVKIAYTDASGVTTLTDPVRLTPGK